MLTAQAQHAHSCPPDMQSETDQIQHLTAPSLRLPPAGLAVAAVFTLCLAGPLTGKPCARGPAAMQRGAYELLTSRLRRASVNHPPPPHLALLAPCLP